jgi:hypothetical protein
MILGPHIPHEADSHQPISQSCLAKISGQEILSPGQTASQIKPVCKQNWFTSEALSWKLSFHQTYTKDPSAQGKTVVCWPQDETYHHSISTSYTEPTQRRRQNSAGVQHIYEYTTQSRPRPVKDSVRLWAPTVSKNPREYEALIGRAARFEERKNKNQGEFWLYQPAVA